MLSCNRIDYLLAENAGISERQERCGFLPQCPGSNADLQVYFNWRLTVVIPHSHTRFIGIAL